MLLKGAGGTFCVGGDVRGMADPNRKAPSLEERIVSLRGRMEASRILHEMSKPVVAAVEGAAAGAGLSLALACDLRVVGETAKITTAFAKVGLSGDYGGTYYLTKLIGSAKARELYLLSPILSGKEAQAIGMMTRCVPDADVVKNATELATQLAKGPTITLGYIKRNINNAEKLVDRSLLRRRSRRPLALRRDGGSQGSRRRLRAEARAGVCEPFRSSLA